MLPLIFLSISLFSCKKGGDDSPPVVPVLKIEDATQLRTVSDATMRLRVTLNNKTTVPVSVKYALVDATAKAATDYVAASGTLTIPAGSASAELPVVIKGDPTDTRRDPISFTVQLSEPKDCQLSVNSAKGIITASDGLNLATDNTGYSTPLSYPGYILQFSDEFNGTALDNAVWNQEIGNGSGGWGNNELEYYTNSTKNTFVSNGNLIIEARKETMGGQNYTSGRMTTQGKKDFLYGRIDIRAKLPIGQGLWPALWMLGANINTVPWPACGEIDIMEMVGTNPGRTHGTMHWKPVTGFNINKGGSYDISGTFSQQFHVFSLVWKQDMITCLVDDVAFFTFTKADVGAAQYPFNAPEFLLMNVAVGGNWPGPPDANTVFPQRMFVDYVRVFQ